MLKGGNISTHHTKWQQSDTRRLIKSCVYNGTPGAASKQESDMLTNNTGNSKCHSRSCSSSHMEEEERRKRLKIEQTGHKIYTLRKP